MKNETKSKPAFKQVATSVGIDSGDPVKDHLEQLRQRMQESANRAIQLRQARRGSKSPAPQQR